MIYAIIYINDVVSVHIKKMGYNMKNTDIDKVRSVAIAFAYLPMEPNEKIPFFVSHPFIDTSITVISTKDGQEMINVLEEDGEKRFIESIVDRLKNTNTLTGFLLLLNKSYRFTFLDHIKGYLSNDDLGVCLRYIWEDSEYTNSGSVFTKKQLLSLFKKSSKEKLMDEEELRTLKELPERITVYRGVTSVNSKDLKVFSWTLSLERAKWFAARFDDNVQEVFQAELPKDGVLAYFSAEEEIVANPFALENIKKT